MKTDKTQNTDACLLTVHVAPRAAKTEAAGMYGDALKIRVQAPPADGKANLALREFVAEKCGLPLAAVTIISGETSKRKILRLTGTDKEEAMKSLA